MESGFLFYFIFFQQKNKYKFLLQKEKNVNQKWKVVSFFILYFFNEKISTNFSYKKRKMSIKNGKWFPFYFIFFQRKNKYKFLLQKEKNVNQKWKVVSFFILLYFFNEKMRTNFSYKK